MERAPDVAVNWYVEKLGSFRNRVVEMRVVRADELLANPLNWRVHPSGQRRAMEGILAEVGVVAPLLAYHSPRAGGALTLIDGHMRLEMGGEWLVLILDVTDTEADLLLATFDPITAMAETDAQMLAGLVTELDMEGDLLDELIARLADEAGVEEEAPAAEDGEVEEDRAEELALEWGVEVGQVWEVGRHRVMCGDSTDGEVAARVMGGAKPALMITDPPYGVDYDASWRNEAALNGHLQFGTRRVGKVENDTRVNWVEAFRHFEGDVLYAWSAGGDLLIQSGQAVQEAGFEIRNQIIWRKPHFPIGRGHYTYQHEPCWYGVRKGRTAHWIGEKLVSTVWEITLDKNVEGGHSTQKPLECMARPLRNHEGDVYDPFLGTGTTLMAAQNTGRVCYAVEIKPGYVAVTLQRYFTATGERPTVEE